MNDDLSELLDSLISNRVEFLVIGAHALAFHGRPRLTEDLDLFVNRATENADRLKIALDEFGAPIGEEGSKKFARDTPSLLRLGHPPNMVDILNFAGSADFSEVYARSLEGELLGRQVRFPNREDLKDMKRVAGRPQDIADIASLD